MYSNMSLITRKFSYHCCASNSVSAISNQAWLLGLTHRLLSRKFKQATCTIAANNHFSFRRFSYFAKISINFLIEPKMALPVSNYVTGLLLRCDARRRQAVYPPFPGNKTEGEKGSRLKIETVPSWRKPFYFRSCKWVVSCRNCLSTVPKLWRAVPCKWGLNFVDELFLGVDYSLNTRKSHMEIPENILLHVGFKKIQSTNQNAELTADIHTLVFSWPAYAMASPSPLTIKGKPWEQSWKWRRIKF